MKNVIVVIGAGSIGQAVARRSQCRQACRASRSAR